MERIGKLWTWRKPRGAARYLRVRTAAKERDGGGGELGRCEFFYQRVDHPPRKARPDLCGSTLRHAPGAPGSSAGA